MPNILYVKAALDFPGLEMLLQYYLSDLYRHDAVTKFVLLSGEKVDHMTFDENTCNKQLGGTTKDEEKRAT